LDSLSEIGGAVYPLLFLRSIFEKQKATSDRIPTQAPIMNIHPPVVISGPVGGF
jgi:hypothetical protein